MAARPGRKSSTGLPTDERTGSWVNSVRVDPNQAGLLFAGTETTVYVSFDNGDHWQSLQQNLPSTSIRDLEVHTDHHQNDLVIGTYGRGFWVLDDITPLREIAAQCPEHQLLAGLSLRARGRHSRADQQQLGSALLHRSAPCDEPAVWRDRGLLPQPGTQRADPAPGLRRGRQSDSHDVQHVAAAHRRRSGSRAIGLPLPRSRALSTHAGLNRVNWNLDCDDPPALRHDLENQMNMVAARPRPVRMDRRSFRAFIR